MADDFQTTLNTLKTVVIGNKTLIKALHDLISKKVREINKMKEELNAEEQKNITLTAKEEELKKEIDALKGEKENKRDSLKKEIENKEKELQDIKAELERNRTTRNILNDTQLKELKKLKEELGKSEEDRERLLKSSTDQKNNLNLQISNLNAEKEELNKKIEKSNKRIEELNNKIDSYKRQIEEIKIVSVENNSELEKMVKNFDKRYK